MVSARTKAEQAQEAARKASADAEVAMSTARQYSPASSQPGVPINTDTTCHTCNCLQSYVPKLMSFVSLSPSLVVQVQQSLTRVCLFVRCYCNRRFIASVASSAFPQTPLPVDPAHRPNQSFWIRVCVAPEFRPDYAYKGKDYHTP